jgi:electron transport complex protein RnfC
MKLKSNKETTSTEEIINFDAPSRVYIPLINQNDDNVTLLVKKGDKVNIGTIIGKRKGNFRIPILSSVSGKVIDTCEHHYLNGNLVRCVVIENDFNDTKEDNGKTRKNICKMSKDDFITSIRDAGIIGAGGAGFPTYIKYSADNINSLIVNMVECEPFITADYTLVLNNVEYILECIDAILEINGIKQAYIAVKKDNSEIIELLNDYLGTYLKIKLLLVDDNYPSGWERNLVEKVTGRSYATLPAEVGVIVSNVSTIYAIYEVLKYHKPFIERIVTFTGNGLKGNANVKVRVGTLVSDVVESLGGYNDGDYMLIAGGPMMGHAIEQDDLVVTPNLNAVTVIPFKPDELPTECLHCGRCIGVCPAGLSPVMIKDNINDLNKLKKLHPERCVSCGACSYICPARIKIKEIVNIASQKVREDNHENI